MHIGYTVYIQTFVLDLQTMFDDMDVLMDDRKLADIHLIKIIQLHDSVTRYKWKPKITN